LQIKLTELHFLKLNSLTNSLNLKDLHDKGYADTVQHFSLTEIHLDKLFTVV